MDITIEFEKNINIEISMIHVRSFAYFFSISKMITKVAVLDDKIKRII
jgi:hypothetical protein